MVMELKICKKREEWDEVVENSPHGTIFHKWEFLKIMEKYSRTKLYPLVGMKGTEIVGIYPLFYQKSYGIKSVLSPPPHLSVLYLGPVFCVTENMRQRHIESGIMEFQEEADRFVFSELGAGYFNMFAPPTFNDSRYFTWTGYDVFPRFNYLNSIEAGEVAVWGGIDKKLRQSIKKAESLGVKIREGGRKELKYLHKAMNARYEEQGKTVNVSLSYLLDVHNAFRKNVRIYTAEHNGNTVTGTVDLIFKDKVSGWIGNPKSSLPQLNANDLINWYSLKWACDNGFRYYETMGAASNERLHSYYSKFNPMLSVSFGASKFSSLYSKVAKEGYTKVLKPVRRFILYGT